MWQKLLKKIKYWIPRKVKGNYADLTGTWYYSYWQWRNKMYKAEKHLMPPIHGMCRCNIYYDELTV